MSDFRPLWGGVGRLMANTILNFHFDYLHPSLSAAEATCLLMEMTIGTGRTPTLNTNHSFLQFLWMNNI